MITCFYKQSHLIEFTDGGKNVDSIELLEIPKNMGEEYLHFMI